MDVPDDISIAIYLLKHEYISELMKGSHALIIPEPLLDLLRYQAGALQMNVGVNGESFEAICRDTS